MNKKSDSEREQARQILKKGILDMSVARLIQMSEFGLVGKVLLSNDLMTVRNVFNRIRYDEKDHIIRFMANQSQEDNFGEIAFKLLSIVEISGCEDEENPDEWLHINIKLEDGTAIDIMILY